MYGLPPDPSDPRRDLGEIWTAAAAAAVALGAGLAAAVFGGRAMTEVRSYHGQPVLKRPVWSWEIPVYFFFGGLAGASAGLAYLAELHGDDELAGGPGRSRSLGSPPVRRC